MALKILALRAEGKAEKEIAAELNTTILIVHGVIYANHWVKRL